MKVDFSYKVLRRIGKDLSIYFDRNIHRWIKTKIALKKEVKRQFIEAAKEAMQKQIKEEEDLILYGDPKAIKPVGILNARELRKEKS